MDKENATFKIDWTSRLKVWAMYGIAFTLAFSLLNLNSIFIILLVAAWVAEGKFSAKLTFLRSNICVIAFALYFFVLLFGIIYASSSSVAWKYIEGKIGLIILPLILGSSAFSQQQRDQIMLVLFSSLTIASLYCLLSRIVDYTQLQDSTIFFYHELVAPIRHHAVYFSVFLFISGIWFLKCSNAFPMGKIFRGVKIAWLTYCAFFLILLSSKLVIIFGAGTILLLLFSGRYRKLKFWYKVAGFILLISIVVVLLKFENPVSKRFADIFKPNTELLKSKYDRATYFNGVEFRLLLWRITYEILHENQAWIFGVGPTNGQTYLNKKYLELDLYAGNDGKRDSGYLVYNCHNQFLQIALQSGLVGLTALCFVCFALARAALKTKYFPLICTIALLFCFFLIESVLERQYGILLATWLPFLLMNTSAYQRRNYS